jgi:N-carbamoyl-L-amino-acid hydrolase
MLRLARVIDTTRQAAETHGCVATIGKLALTPNAANAIPSHVTAWLDARGPDEEWVRAVAADVQELARVRLVPESFTPRESFDAGLVARLSALLDEAPILESGAGHDAGTLASAGVPTAMLFVRNPTGVSHSPLESAEDARLRCGREGAVLGSRGPGASLNGEG